MGISIPEFEYLRKLIREGSAIVLDSDKQYLAESRLASLLSKEGFSSVQKMLEEMRFRPSSELNRKVLDAMTNNETWFFRDLEPFQVLRSTILPDLIQRRQRERTLTIWSAASSSGQEAYSIAMLIREHFPLLLGWDLSIVATDISGSVLHRAKQGRYTQLEVNRGLPVQMLAKYFEQQGLEWQLSELVRKMVTFRLMNLADAWPDMPTFDIVFLRNVLIYFDVDTKKQILARVARKLAPEGYVLLGCAETTLNLSDDFERLQCGKMFCYRASKARTYGEPGR